MISEKNIINLFRKNKNEAYTYIYATYYRSLVNFAFKYVENEGAAQDIIQDVLISLLDVNKAGFKTIQEIKIYLYKAVKNRAISYIRHNNVVCKYAEIVRNDKNCERFFLEGVMEEDIYSNLMQAIDMLPPRCGSVMRLSLEGRKISEIAQQLLISEDTVKEHRGVAKSKLRLILKKMDLTFFI